MQSLPPPPAHFTLRKQAILRQLAVPEAEYADASPKGTVDAGIRELVDEINAVDGLATTSSCAGRACVFLEGARAPSSSCSSEAAGDEDGGDSRQRLAGVGGKGGGGRWLFVSHEPFDLAASAEDAGLAAVLGMGDDPEAGVPALEEEQEKGEEGRQSEQPRLIHFKFEPMILHILTASPEHAQLVLGCGLGAGFRESGAVNLIGTPVVAVRSAGLAFSSLIGTTTASADDGRRTWDVSAAGLGRLAAIANERFEENARRMGRFRDAMRAAATRGRERPRRNPQGLEWEDADARRARKRAEGLRRRAELEEGGEARGEVVLDPLSHGLIP